MRPKGLIALGVFIMLITVVAYLLSDRIVETQIENAGANMVGAKVEIDNLDFRPLELSISLDRLQVTNPNDTWKNIIETGRMSFDMEVTPLFRNKVVINDITFADLRFGTKRETDGKIATQPAKPGWFYKAKNNLIKQVESAPVLNLGILKKKVNVDSLMAIVDIQSVNRIQRARQRADSTFNALENRISEFKPKHNFQQIEQQVQELTTQKVDNLEQLVSTLEKTKKVHDSVKQIKQDFTGLKSSATASINTVTETVSSFDNWIQDDIDAIKGLAKIGDFSSQNIGKMLFGNAVAMPTIDLLELVGISREYMPIAEKAQKFLQAGKVENPPRFAGQDIKFPILHGKPKFLLEHVLISGATNQQDTSKVLRASGEIRGITSHPRVYGKPLTFDLKARLPNSNAFQATGELDHTSDVAKDRFTLKAANIALGQIALGERPYLPSNLVAKSGDLSGNFAFIGDQLDFEFSLTARPVSFQFPEMQEGNNLIAQVTRGVFNDIEQLKLKVGIKGKIESLGLRISSNIDDILAQRINSLVGESVKVAQAEIRKRVDALVEPKKQEALAFINKNKTDLTTRVTNIENQIDEKLAVLDDKRDEIEKKIEEKKKEGLEGVSDKLKDIFKK